MSRVIDIRAFVDPSVVPTLVLIDIQQESVASPRALALPRAAEALANCRAALNHARSVGIPIAFVRSIGRAPFFSAATHFSRWIEGFEPNRHDIVFERGQPSCYASRLFNDVMSSGGGNFVLAGFAGETACLATAIDAFHRDHRFTFLADASASHGLDELEAEQVHDVVTRVIGLYGDVMNTRTWIAGTSRRGAGLSRREFARGTVHEWERNRTT